MLPIGNIYCKKAKHGPRTTVRLIARDDMVSRSNIRDAFSNGFYHASCFMTKHTRKKTLWVVPVERIRIRIAESSCYNLHSYFSWTWRCNADICDF
jgi:hypothetical protein